MSVVLVVAERRLAENAKLFYNFPVRAVRFYNVTAQLLQMNPNNNISAVDFR